MRIAPQRGCELVIVVHVSGGREGPVNSRYLWIGVFQGTSVPGGSAGSVEFTGRAVSVVCAKGGRSHYDDLPVSQRAEDGSVQRPFHVVANPVDERSGAGHERAVVSHADDGGACRSV